MSSPIAARTEETPPRRRLIHRLFEASLLFKGLFAGFETLAGLTLFVTPGAAILELLDRVTAPELAQDPRDLLARAMLDASQRLSIETQHFYALYLLTHGGVKLVMVLLLARGLHWAYTVAMAVLALFIAYQIHLFVLGDAGGAKPVRRGDDLAGPCRVARRAGPDCTAPYPRLACHPNPREAP